MRVVGCRHCGHSNRLPAAGHGIPRCGDCHQPLPWITAADDDDFAEIVDNPSMLVLVNIWAPWCAQCARANPAMEHLAETLAGQVKLVEVDVTRAPRLQRRFVVESVPTLLLLQGPLVAAYRAGSPPEPSLRAWLAQAAEHVRASGDPLAAPSPAAAPAFAKPLSE
ncbi:MAG TPA: thioredoxin family protein [Streptosporangiaceae bacterium]|nr:thioredoxin family protein [Streptosporangiaceae bacterium]